MALLLQAAKNKQTGKPVPAAWPAAIPKSPSSPNLRESPGSAFHSQETL